MQFSVIKIFYEVLVLAPSISFEFLDLREDMGPR